MTKNEIEMVKRTNGPFIKIWLQTTIKKVFEDNLRMTTQEFIKALEDKGINLLFNRASTGYVSGISYGYGEFMITGSKLGNDFKWTAIKNKIDYQQERDLGLIRKVNDCTKSIDHSKGINALTGKSNGVYLLVTQSFGKGVASLLNDPSHNHIPYAGNPQQLDSDPLGLRKKKEEA